VRIIFGVLSPTQEIYATVVTLSADYPLTSGHQTPLEVDHAAFLLSIAHQADFCMGVRLLDTGTARDVSGVIRITVGDAGAEAPTTAQKVEEKELLYFVGGDGTVKVFERGQ
jgi:elongator complex protein 6